MAFIELGRVGNVFRQTDPRLVSSERTFKRTVYFEDSVVFSSGASAQALARSANFSISDETGWALDGEGNSWFYGTVVLGGDTTLLADLTSGNWDGSTPVSLPDAGATAGYALDYSTGRAQFQSIYAKGGELGDLDVTGDVRVTTGQILVGYSTGNPIVVLSQNSTYGQIMVKPDTDRYWANGGMAIRSYNNDTDNSYSELVLYPPPMGYLVPPLIAGENSEILMRSASYDGSTTDPLIMFKIASSEIARVDSNGVRAEAFEPVSQGTNPTESDGPNQYPEGWSYANLSSSSWPIDTGWIETFVDTSANRAYQIIRNKNSDNIPMAFHRYYSTDSAWSDWHVAYPCHEGGDSSTVYNINVANTWETAYTFTETAYPSSNFTARIHAQGRCWMNDNSNASRLRMRVGISRDGGSTWSYGMSSIADQSAAGDIHPQVSYERSRGSVTGNIVVVIQVQSDNSSSYADDFAVDVTIAEPT